MTVRDAGEGDLVAILAIYNDVIRTSTAVYTEVESTLAERRAWWEQRVSQAYPVLVCVDESAEVRGFASFGDFRGAWPGYRYSVEHSVHVRPDSRGGGIGTALMSELLQRGTRLQKHVMVAGIDAANDASIRFHGRLGFESVGTFREVGYKFDRWLDLHFMQRIL